MNAAVEQAMIETIAQYIFIPLLWPLTFIIIALIIRKELRRRAK
jgi:hypothetical protein